MSLGYRQTTYLELEWTYTYLWRWVTWFYNRLTRFYIVFFDRRRRRGVKRLQQAWVGLRSQFCYEFLFQNLKDSINVTKTLTPFAKIQISVIQLKYCYYIISYTSVRINSWKILNKIPIFDYCIRFGLYHSIPLTSRRLFTYFIW